MDSSYAATSITTASNGGALIGGLGFDSSNSTATPPSGWAERWETNGGHIAEQADRIQDVGASTTPTLKAVDAPHRP